MKYVLLLNCFNCVFSKEKAVLEGNLRLSPADSKGKKTNPKQEQVKLDEKKATFEQLDRQAEQVSILYASHADHVCNAIYFCVFQNVYIVNVFNLNVASVVIKKIFFVRNKT